MSDSSHDPLRRKLLIGAGSGLATASLGALAGPSTKGSMPGIWQLQADVVVVGSGAAALTAAVVAQAAGDRVLILEKGPISGGTSRKSGGVFWIPNHYALRAQGIHDDKMSCLQYLCRMSYPEKYYPDSPTMGLDADAYQLLEAFYDNGFHMVDRLREPGALHITPFNMWNLQQLEPDYQNHLPEDKVSHGRSLGVLKADGNSGSGSDYIDQLESYLARQGVAINTDYEVTRLIQNDQGDVVGVTAQTENGEVAIRARKAVIFGTGGYPHNLDYVRYYQRTFLYDSCATPFATGDFIGIAVAPGPIGTPMLRNADPEGQNANQVPLNRIGTTRELANAVLWLARDSASYVSGSVLTVDGAFLAL